MGGGFSFPEAGSHQSICQVVSVMVRSPGLLVTFVYGVKGCHCSTKPTWERKSGAISKAVIFGKLKVMGFLQGSPSYI